MDAVILHGSLLSFSSAPHRRPFARSKTSPKPLRPRAQSNSIDPPKPEYDPGPLDDLFLTFFRGKMVEVGKVVYIIFPTNELQYKDKEVGWDSEKPGYDGLIDVANRLMSKGGNNLDVEQSAVRVLKSLFPPLLLPLFKMLITPIGGGRIASKMLARATALSCQWLMGPCSVNSIDLPDGSSCTSGVFVERCKYLEESKCLGVCINTCKLPTQTFFRECMGVPLVMEPNFSDYSCQFKFGVLPPSPDKDEALGEPCLEICPNAYRRKNLINKDCGQCPQV